MSGLGSGQDCDLFIENFGEASFSRIIFQKMVILCLFYRHRVWFATAVQIIFIMTYADLDLTLGQVRPIFDLN